jgi:hypothetical protein
VRYAIVDNQLANVQPLHFKVINAQRAHMPPFQGKCANDEPSDRKRTHRSGAEGDRTECHGTETESANGVRQRTLISSGVTSGRLRLSNSSLPDLYVVHGAPRASAIVFDILSNVADGVKEYWQRRWTAIDPLPSSGTPQCRLDNVRPS